MFFLVCKFLQVGPLYHNIFQIWTVFYLKVFSIDIHKNCKTKHYFFYQFFLIDTILVCKLYTETCDRWFNSNRIKDLSVQFTSSALSDFFFLDIFDLKYYCYLIMSSLKIKALILEVLVNVFIDRFLLVAFVFKYILSQIHYHGIQNCTF